MNTVELHDESDSDDSGHRTFSLMVSARFLTCAVVILMATLAPSLLADAQVFGYVGPIGLVSLTNVRADARVTAIRRKARYHIGLVDLAGCGKTL